MEGKRVGIREIAAQAGLGISTVSMALRNDPKIAPATRERVQRLARQMGYRPNPAFSAVGSCHHRKPVGQKGLPLAYLYESDRQKSAYGRDTELAGLVSRAAFRLGYNVQVFNVREFETPDKASRILFSRGFAGVFLGSYLDEDFFSNMNLSRMAVVCVQRYFRDLPFTSIRFSRLQMVRKIVETCWERGYRRIGLLRGFHRYYEHSPKRSRSGHWDYEDFSRLAGYLAAIAENPELASLQHYQGPPRDLDQIRVWLDLTQPDVIIGLTPLDYYMLKELGLRVPEDIALVNQAIDDRHQNFITGIFPDLEHLAAAAAEMLDSLLRNSHLGPLEIRQEVVIPPRWCEGDTLPWRNSPGLPAQPKRVARHSGLSGNRNLLD